MRKFFRSAAVLLGLVVAGSARADGFGPHPVTRPTSGFGHVDRSGMNEHVVRGLAEGLITGAFIGYAVSSDTDERTATRTFTGAVLGGAAGVVLPLVLNRGGKEVRTGDVVFINVAQNWGLAHGFLVPLLFQLPDIERRTDVEGIEDEDAFTTDQLRLDLGLSAALSLAAGGLAAHASSDLNFTPGQASSIGSAGLWGGFTGLLLMSIVGPDDPGARWGQATIGATLALADAAMLATWYNRDAFDIERSRVLMVNLAGVAGSLVGLAGAYFIDPGLDSDRVVSGAVLAGAGVGLVSGYLLTDAWDDYKRAAPPVAGSGLSLVEYRAGKWGAGLPMPTLGLTPGTRKMKPYFSLLDGRF